MSKTFTEKAFEKATEMDAPGVGYTKEPDQYMMYEELTPAVLAEISMKLDRIVALLEQSRSYTPNGISA